MPPPLLLAIDLGTQSVRAVLVDDKGNFIKQHRRTLAIQRDQDGFVEQNATDINSATSDVINKVLMDTANVKSAALAIQRSSVVAWSKVDGGPLSPVLSWQDTRAANKVQQLKASTEEIKRRSGLVLSAHYGASKLWWLMENNVAVKRAHALEELFIGPLVSNILYHQLNEKRLICDESNAARTQLWNIKERHWDEQLCEWYAVPKSILPAVLPCADEYGTIKGTDIPLNVVCGDQNAAFFGVGELPKDSALINLGSGAFILADTGEKPQNDEQLLTTLAFSTPTTLQHLLEATVNGAGSSISWAARILKIRDVFELLESWLEDNPKPPLFINSIGGLGSPWWRNDITPEFLYEDPQGANNPGARIAAIIESIVFLLQSNLYAMRGAGFEFKQLYVSGGLSKSNGLCQKLADLTGVDVLRSRKKETTIMGLSTLSNHIPTQEPAVQRRFKPQLNQGIIDRYNEFNTAMIERLD